MEVTVCPHKDLVGCTSMSLNSSSSLALLAGRRSYGIVNLATPDQLAYKETRQSKWEVICSEWSALEDRLVAVASNNKVELLTWTGSELVVDTSLRAHTRLSRTSPGTPTTSTCWPPVLRTPSSTSGT